MENKLNFATACEEFETLLHRLDGVTSSQFQKWLRSKLDHEHVKNIAHFEKDKNADKILRSIADDLRRHPKLPISAVVETERIAYPSVGEFADVDRNTVVHVDKFLYEDDDSIDGLCDQGLISRNYCADCGSHNTSPLNFISHSASLVQIKFIFHDILPDLKGKTVVDVGSRLGAILFGAYHYSSASSIIGIELNSDLCHLQEEVVERYAMTDRIKVICADIMNRRDLLETADVVILHNVFEFFMNTEDQKRIWQYIHQAIRKKGCFIVSVPSLEASWEALECPLTLDGWVKKLPVSVPASRFDEEDKEDLMGIHLYQVT